jgi:hypothetical protein
MEGEGRAMVSSVCECVCVCNTTRHMTRTRREGDLRGGGVLEREAADHAPTALVLEGVAPVPDGEEVWVARVPAEGGHLLSLGGGMGKGKYEMGREEMTQEGGLLYVCRIVRYLVAARVLGGELPEREERALRLLLFVFELRVFEGMSGRYVDPIQSKAWYLTSFPPKQPPKHANTRTRTASEGSSQNLQS